MISSNKRTQKGGKVLGEGGFGCIISPPLQCKNPFLNIPYSIDDKYISKIVEYDEDDSEMMNELKIGSKLLRIDPNQKYISPIINGCVFFKQNSNNIVYKRYKLFNNDTKTDSNKKCNIYTNEDYLNLISKNAGINLADILDNKSP
jgi:hypothetical protein